MKKLIKEISYGIYSSVDDLNLEDANLLKEAIKAQEKAYAPYSKFKVGAALLLKNGEIILGNNQENAAYPSGLCAERVAFFHYGSTGNSSPIKTVAIIAGSSDFETLGIISPCGSCRQVMAEYESNQQSPIRILLKSDSDEVYEMESIESILPFVFQSEGLKS
jgi:cytidine deaminase